MRPKDLELLTGQLDQALADGTEDGDSVLEVAALAGLIERIPDHDPASLAAARDWRDGPGDEQLDDVLRRLPTHESLERITAATDEDEREERLDALFELDELCAAATWAYAEAVVRPAARQAQRFIHAFPHVWRDLEDVATGILARQPPRPGDPAALFWRAIEATRFEQDQPSASWSLADAVDMGAIAASLSGAWLPATWDQPRAAGALPDAPPYLALVEDDRLEVALTAENGRRLLTFAVPSGDVLLVTCDGQPVELEPADEHYQCDAVEGSYRIVVGDDAFELTLES